MRFDLPTIHFNASPSSFSSPSYSSSIVKFPASVSNTSHIRQTCTASCCFCSGESCTRLESAYGKEYPTRTDYVMFGPPPSYYEVESAIASLHNFMKGLTPYGSELNELQQILDRCSVTTLLSQGCGRLRDAFSLLQTDPSIKRLVVSLSSDRAIWDAVMNNEVVRKLQDSYHGGESSGSSKSCDEKQDIAASLLKWVLDMTKIKVMELIQGFLSLMNEVFQPLGREKRIEAGNDAAEDKVRSSLLLSIVILLIVVVARMQNA